MLVRGNFNVTKNAVANNYIDNSQSAKMINLHASRMRRNLLISTLLTAASVGLGALAFAAKDRETPHQAPQGSFQDCEECPEMLVIPAGRFMMGFDGGEPERYEGPVREISIEHEFAAGRTEVTVRQYAAFVSATGYQAAVGCLAWDGVSATLVEAGNWRNPGYGRPAHPDEPAVCLSWTDANAYVEWLADKTGQPYQLLSEAQWEYAADAGSDAIYPWGVDPAAACTFGNIFDLDAADARPDSPLTPVACRDGEAEVARVGSFTPNDFGLYDMVGNVWEWTADCYVMPAPAAPVDGSPVVTDECDRRSVKGGSWITRVDRQRPTFRGRDEEKLVSQVFGFRVGRALQQ